MNKVHTFVSSRRMQVCALVAMVAAGIVGGGAAAFATDPTDVLGGTETSTSASVVTQLGTFALPAIAGLLVLAIAASVFLKLVPRIAKLFGK